MSKSLMGRGIISDGAKKLSDVVDRVASADALAVSPKSFVATCPHCGGVVHMTTEKNLPPGWKRIP